MLPRQSTSGFARLAAGAIPARRTLGVLLLTACLASAGPGPEYGVVTVAGRTYRDVIGACRLHPFLTDADVLIHFTDTRGRVSVERDEATFVYPGIEQVLVNGAPLPSVRSGPNLIRVKMAPGVHDVAIAAAPDAASPDLPRGFGAAGDVVGSLDEFRERAAALGPGAELVVKNGVYSGWHSVVVTGAGTEDKPILIRPETPGGVIFRQRTQIRVQGTWVVLKGFRFEHAGPGQIVHLTDGERNRVTQCQFWHCGNPAFSFSHVVRVGSNCHRSRVDHCWFTGSRTISLGLRVRGRETAPLDNRFDHNVFRDIFRFWRNGQENIQLGGGAPEVEPRCTVENCLFDHAWGDSEIISNKTSRNVIRYNLAAHCLFSTFSLRQGCDVRFAGNVMANNAGGIRVWGKRHILVNNLFLDLPGQGVSLETGSRDGRLRIAAEDVLIANNTFVDCSGGGLSSDRTSASNPFPVRNPRVANNLLSGARGVLLDVSGAVDPEVNRNLFWASGQATAGEVGRGAILRNPQLQGAGPAVRPAPGSPAVDAAAPLPEVALDRWRRQRPHGAAPDIGADEVGAGERPLDLLPDMPRPPLVLPDLYKKQFAFAVGAPTAGREIELVDAAVAAQGKLPPDFVMEWEHLPDDFDATGSLRFCATDHGPGYAISWGGVDQDGVPLGVITLRKGASAEALADGPDTLCHRMNYRRGAVSRKPSAKRPAKWYAFTLIKQRGLIWLALRPPTAFGDLAVVPVLVWDDRGLVGGPPLAGDRVSLEQQGRGRWRNVNVWRFGRVPPAAPAAPTQLTAQADGAGRIALRWRHGAPGRVDAVYEIHRSNAPEFTPSRDNCIAGNVLGVRYDDFDVAENAVWHYRIRARNAFGMTSGFVTLRAAAAAGGPLYLLLKASSARKVEPPFVVDRDPDSAETFLQAPLHSGSAMDAPPPQGLAEFAFTVAKEGDYCIWLSTKADNHSQDSFYVSLDGDDALDSYRGFSANVQRTWTWRKFGQFRLAPGEHAFRIKPREPGARLKAVLITDNLALDPADG